VAGYDAPMNPATASSRNQLRSIARRAMLERDLLPDFSAAVAVETGSIASAAAATDSSLRDLRHMLWASIDNDDSLDLDQLSFAEQLPGGTVNIFVAVADVDAIVKKGSAIDDHARTNTTSVYTAAEIFPMLPEKLSTDLTSLADGKERLAIVIEMEVGSDGAVGKSNIYRAVVMNRAKLTYNGVAAWLEGTAPAPAPISAVSGLDQNLRLQDRVAQTMKTRRHHHGALTLETIEPRPVFDSDSLSDLQADRKNRATELIEDFMIGANGVTARYLEGKSFPTLRRVLRAPERWARIVDLAEDLGERLPPRPECQALQEFLEKRQQAEPRRTSTLRVMGIGQPEELRMRSRRSCATSTPAPRTNTSSRVTSRRVSTTSGTAF
jgi:VacB/RNase II family 3'-5' exoribonuclease